MGASSLTEPDLRIVALLRRILEQASERTQALQLPDDLPALLVYEGIWSPSEARALLHFAEALADLLEQESLPALERRLRRYTTPALLILDEIGYLPCDSAAADLLFNIVTRRHERRSLVITTNLSFKQWGTLFGGAACVAALVDRFAQHCHTIDIVADSWRQKHALRQAACDGASHPAPSPAPRRRRAAKEAP